MSPQVYERKLTAILSADVAGYSRLMGEDEDLTIKTLTGYREMMTSLIEKHKGRVVDSPGDNMLSTFPSVTQDVDCAMEIQEELRVIHAELPENRRMDFRILQREGLLNPVCNIQGPIGGFELSDSKYFHTR